MAKRVQMEKNGVVENAYEGFSWTTLFFSFVVPVVRGDSVWSGIMFAASLVLILISQESRELGIIIRFITHIVIALVYNKKHMSGLVNKGYRVFNLNEIYENMRKEIKAEIEAESIKQS